MVNLPIICFLNGVKVTPEEVTKALQEKFSPKKTQKPENSKKVVNG